MAIFGPKAWVNPFEKCQFFDFLNFSFLQPRKVFFGSRIMLKIFSWPILPKNKQLEKWPFLDQNHGLPRLEKIPIFRLFEVCVFIAQKGVFCFQNIVKAFFLAYIALKKKIGKMAIFGPKAWVNPLEKCQFFDFLTFSFLQRTKVFFGSGRS